MGNSSGSMLYMVVLLIIIYVVGMGIYQGVKFIQKKREEAKDKLRQLADGKYGVIYITEAVAAQLTDVIEEYQERTFPAIIQIPGVSGNTGAGVEGVKKTVEQAVGSDILFSEE